LTEKLTPVLKGKQFRNSSMPDYDSSNQGSKKNFDIFIGGRNTGPRKLDYKSNRGISTSIQHGGGS